MNLSRILAFLSLFGLFSISHSLAVPPLLNHQGRIAVSGVNFTGAGSFRFALVNSDGSVTYWSNDGTSSAGSEPVSAVSLTVTRGLYAVLLGDTSLSNMDALPPEVFRNEDVHLRVWFDDGANGSEQISPDHRLAAAPFAQVASRVDQILISDLLAPPSAPVVAWGDNFDGQVTTPSLTNVTAVAAGSRFSLALLTDGSVIQWGTGAAIPVGLDQVTHIAAGTAHALARRSDGTIAVWGDNSFGQGVDTAGFFDASDVAAGEKHSLVLRNDGTVSAWGNNSFGQLDIPSGLSGVTAIAAGYDHNLALRNDGSVVAWGRNDSGQSAVPPGLTDVVFVAAGAYHSLAVTGSGTVVAWGWDTGGQSTVPPGLSGVVGVAGGFAFSVAVREGGEVVAWGDNSEGQLDIPAGLSEVAGLAAGASHALALRAELVPALAARLDEDNVFDGSIGIGRVAATNRLEVEGQASKSVAGNWLANSDRRIKTDVQPVEGALETLGQVRLVEFLYTDDYRKGHPGVGERRYLNVIAQEFAEVFPGHVAGSGEFLEDGSEILQVDTYPLTIYSAAAIQELVEENEVLKERMAEQEKRLKEIELLLESR